MALWKPAPPSAGGTTLETCRMEAGLQDAHADRADQARISPYPFIEMVCAAMKDGCEAETNRPPETRSRFINGTD